MAEENEALELYQPDQKDIMLHRPPSKVLAEAKEAAMALTDVINKKPKPVKFNGEQYLEFEDWQTVGRFYGITAKVRDTRFVQYDKVSGFEASADALLVATGQIISSADAMCLNDEVNWSRKPMFQLRSMSQTRACAKALRNVLAWVVVLAGYKPTPAEEMDGVHSAPPPQQETLKPSDPPQEAPKQASSSGRKITDKQRKRMYAIARGRGMTDKEFELALRSMNYESSADVTMDSYEDVCMYFEGWTKEQSIE